MTNQRICPECGQPFIPRDTDQFGAPGGSAQRYCSKRCKRQAENRRAYLKRKKKESKRNE